MTPHPTPRRTRWRRVAAVLALLLVLLLVGTMYTQPTFLVMMVDQVWGCF